MYYKANFLNTIGDVFDVALYLAKNGTKTEQENFFQEYAESCANDNAVTFDEGIRIAQSNLGYFSGYCDNDTCTLIHRVYCHH